MAKDRQLTPEERRLWRAVTQHDEVYAPPLPIEDDTDAEPQPQTPAAINVSTSLAREAGTNPLPRAKPPNPVLEGRKATRLLRPYAPVEATLDLHGMDKITAYEAVQDFIDRAQRAGLRHVLIITGKGRTSEGILRAQLPHWLNEPGLRRMVVGIAQASPNRGGSGVYHVVLKRA